jgi:Pentapeptide repeats (8 copies)
MARRARRRMAVPRLLQARRPAQLAASVGNDPGNEEESWSMAQESKPRFAVDDVNLAGATFNNVSLAQARFTDINLSGSFFDNINFTNAAIGKHCNFTGATIAGIAVEELLAAYRNRPK